MDLGNLGGLAGVSAAMAIVGSALTGALRHFVAGLNAPRWNIAICTVLSVLSAAIAPRIWPELPHDLATWLTIGGAAAGLGQTGHNTMFRDSEDE